MGEAGLQWVVTAYSLGMAIAMMSAGTAADIYGRLCEGRSADPMMDLKLFRDRTYSLAIIAIFAVMFTEYGMVLVVMQYLQNMRGFSPTDPGLLLLSYSASMMVVSLMAGKLVGVVGSRRRFPRPHVADHRARRPDGGNAGEHNRR